MYLDLLKELEDGEDRYKEIHANQVAIKKKYQREIEELKRRLEEAAAEVDFAKSSRHGKLSVKGKENYETEDNFTPRSKYANRFNAMGLNDSP